MGQMVSFEDHALARLRARLGEAEEAREDLIAFARGHSGAVSAIHEAVLMMMQARDAGDMLRVVTVQWPGILAVDHVALILIVDGEAYLATRGSTARMELRLAQRAMRGHRAVELREVERGHSLFGPHSQNVRAEALIAVDCGPGLPGGLLLLGQEQSCPIDDRHGAQLLRFLGEALAAMIAGWLRATKS